MPSNRSKLFFILAIILLFYSGSYGQTEPKTYTIAGISVEGNRFADAQTIVSLSGLQVGEQITIPGDSKIQIALKSLWSRRQFSDVEIVIDKITGIGVFLKIKVKEFQRLSGIEVQNNKELKTDEIIKAVGKSRGEIITPYDLYLIKQRIKNRYREEDLLFAEVEAELVETDTAYFSKLVLAIDEGLEFYVRSVKFEGNNAFDNSDLLSAFDKTGTKKWWQFWRSSKYNNKDYEQDKQLLIKFYQKNGFKDIEILKDTVIYDPANKAVDIVVTVSEGNRLFVRNITVAGNSTYPSELLLSRLDFQKGDPYDMEKFSKNLNGNEDQTDLASVYLNTGYLFARFDVEETRVSLDSIDLHIRVNEGNRVTIRKVDIVGNTKTMDKVIRRELYTRPGDYFNRASIIRSVKGLGLLNYFNPEALRPDVKLVDNTKVDVVYKVEERSSDTFNASIGFAGYFGLTGAIGFSFNNFSISDPLRGGAGQMFNFNWEFGQANRFNSISLSFSEPWLFGQPTSLGFSIYDTRISYNYDLRRTGVALNIGRRFRWPDDFFRGDWSVRVQRNDVGTEGALYFRPGISTEITIAQTFSRISLDNLYFPTEGSRFSFSTDFAMGSLGLGNTDYFKNHLKFEINQPLLQIKDYNRFVLHLSSQWGYVFGFKSDTTISPIELYYMGGNGLSGYGNITPLRGYSDRSIGPDYGGKVISKHTAELRFALSVDPMPIWFYTFMEAGNVWNSIKETDPFNLKRAAGVGLQIMLNPIGLIGFSYGYGFDRIDKTGQLSGWQFLFHLGTQ
ncbi:MAG: outer membrane protein assembly factor BamA [Candidatus Kapabacteria bacterium]|nr:outer membrane protein assembly factor BamA [Candidatus Kapabacteria bacterium]